jgi:hypothetical protein
MLFLVIEIILRSGFLFVDLFLVAMMESGDQKLWGRFRRIDDLPMFSLAAFFRLA